jgi:hypothetical protein
MVGTMRRRSSLHRPHLPGHTLRPDGLQALNSQRQPQQKTSLRLPKPRRLTAVCVSTSKCLTP